MQRAASRPVAVGALLANASLARLYWRTLDASDYWLTQARWWGRDQDPMPHPSGRSGGGWRGYPRRRSRSARPGSIIIAKPTPILLTGSQ